MKGLWLVALAVMSLSGCVKRTRPHSNTSQPTAGETLPSEGEGEIPPDQDQNSEAADAEEATANDAQAVDSEGSEDPAPPARRHRRGQRASAVSEGKRLYDLAIFAIHEHALERAMAYYLTSCQYGWIHSCHRYGWHLERHNNYPGANQFYTLACIRGFSKSCNNIGHRAEVNADWAEASNYYGMACGLGHKRSCRSQRRVEGKASQSQLPAH